MQTHLIQVTFALMENEAIKIYNCNYDVIF